MGILHILEEEMEEIEEVMEGIEEEEEEEVLEIEVIEEDMEEREEIEVIEVMVTVKEEMNVKVEDGMVKIKTGKSSQLIQLNSTTILEMINQSTRNLKIKNILNQLTKVQAQHIPETLSNIKSQNCIMKERLSTKTHVIKSLKIKM